MSGRQTPALRLEPGFCPLQLATQKPRSRAGGGPSPSSRPSIPTAPRFGGSSPRILPSTVSVLVERCAPQALQPSPRRPRPSRPWPSPSLAGSHRELAAPAAGLAEKAVRVASAVWRRKCGLIIDPRLLQMPHPTHPV